MTSKLTREFMQNIISGHGFGVAPSAVKAMAEYIVAAMDSEPVIWNNGCNKSVPAALRYLAENQRPIGGESSFNTAHLYQLAREIELMAEAPLYRHAQPAPETECEPIAWLNDAYLARGVVDGEACSEDAGPGCIPVYREASPAQPAPVVPDEMLCEFYEVANWPDLVRELVKHVEQLQDSAKRNVKPWEDTFPETLLPAYIDRIKQADEACRAAMLQAGNSPQSMKCKTADELLACVPRNTGRSREHFISLCNEFWNWSEMDLVCADEKGYEPTMEWNGTKFTHRVTQALWRMYQAAPVNSPVIPDGYVMVPKDLLSELRDWAHPEIEKYCEMWEGRRDSEFPALRKVIADADALLAAAPQESKS